MIILIFGGFVLFFSFGGYRKMEQKVFQVNFSSLPKVGYLERKKYLFKFKRKYICIFQATLNIIRVKNIK